MSISRPYRMNFLLLAGVIGVLFFGIGYMPLSADEPIRALVALDMDLNGHYLTPELNGDSYLNKPPLYNWILLALFKLMGNYSEWIIRLPSIIPLLLFIPLIYRISVKHGIDKNMSFLASLAFVTTGNIWFYSSYLGHIDILFSLITFIQLYLIITLSERQKWLLLFATTYLLAAIGFLMKGLPSIVFQGITIAFVLIQNKNFKKIISWEHFIGLLFFVIPVLSYLLAYSHTGNVQELAMKLVTESTSRTVADKSFLESISHIFSFPILLFLDLMPWGLIGFVFLSKEVRTRILQNKFYKSCLWVFVLNIVVYWLSPDYRARYIFMLIPFVFIPGFAGLQGWVGRLEKFWYWLVFILQILCVPLVVYLYLFYQPKLEEFNLLITILASIILILAAFWTNKARISKELGILVQSVVLMLIVARLIFSLTIVPMKVQTGPYMTEKKQAQDIVDIVKDEPLGMYSSNISLTMNWYISAERKQMLTTQRSNYNLQSYYLIPTEVLLDPENVDVYYSFTRRYESKDFSLVKFRKYFPEMLKEK